MKKGFTHICHTKHPLRHAEFISASDKQRIPVSVETLSTHFFLFGSNAARKKKRDSRFSSINPVISAAWMRKSSLHSKPATGSFSTESFQRKNKRRLLAACQICFANLYARFAFALARNGGGVKGARACGFTLAEVLITLAIIGTVAALTIPTVMRKIQDQQLKAQFKVVYSDMQRVFSKTVLIDFGGNLNCYYSKGYVISECVHFFKVFSENLRVIKYCSSNAYENGCIPKYNNVNTGCGVSGFSTDQINYISPVRVLANGSILIPYSNGIYPMFALDINGKKSPNKWGYDVFILGIGLNNKNQVVLNGGVCASSVEEGGRTLVEMFKFVHQ